MGGIVREETDLPSGIGGVFCGAAAEGAFGVKGGAGFHRQVAKGAKVLLLATVLVSHRGAENQMPQAKAAWRERSKGKGVPVLGRINTGKITPA